ncbi:MAG: dihydropteroate synthase [Bacteroidetes bacterium]|nr:dihydropteroate synthase [Bacteroidota bacterium]
MNQELLKHPLTKASIQVRGKLLSFGQPLVMGILNATPDSFHDESRVMDVDSALKQAERHIQAGAHILDLGAYSTRPGASDIPIEEERRRLLPLVEKISQNFPDIPLSVDTFRSELAKETIAAGAGIINDISAGDADPAMLFTVAQMGVPIILMHKKGMPANMQNNPQYQDVVGEVFDYLIKKKGEARSLGIRDVILDVGFGFGKSATHNFSLMKHLSVYRELNEPLLVGVSRKGMVWRNLGIHAREALNGTTALHMQALLNGANILRVHDVKEALECIRLYKFIEEAP